MKFGLMTEVTYHRLIVCDSRIAIAHGVEVWHVPLTLAFAVVTLMYYHTRRATDVT